MTPTPPTTTSRLKVQYSGPGAGTHHLLFHGTDPGNAVDLTAVAADFVEALLPVLWNGTVFSSAEFADPGSPFFFPSSWTPQTAATVNTFGVGSNPAQFLQFGGRDGDGVRVKLYLFEVALAANSKMRYDFGDFTAVDDALDVLSASGAELRTIAGAVPSWKNYANWGVNDYLTHRSRRAG